MKILKIKLIDKENNEIKTVTCAVKELESGENTQVSTSASFTYVNAYVITIIILLILAGVAISMITGGEGLFAQANEAATKYNQAAKNEADLLNELLNGNYFGNGGNGQGGEEDNPQVPEKPEVTTKSHVGYYADMDANGTVDGIIFADLAVGGSGEWGTNGNGAYTIPVKTELKEYYISKKEHEGIFGTKDVLSPKEGSTGENRFYIMALENFGGNTSYAWYNAAYGEMTDYTTATSVEFGTGRANTTKMIEYWNNKTYGEQNSGDMWGVIQEKVNEGWFVPSRAEWAAFGGELGITKVNYGNYGLSYYCWSSSQGGESDTGGAWGAYFYADRVYGSNDCYVRLATTF